MTRAINRTLLIILGMILGIGLAISANAAPFLTCDPQEGVTKYELTLGSGAPAESVANPDGSAWHDLANAPEGRTNASIKAGGPWTIDDDDQVIFVWSDPSPFVLGRPSVSSPPSNMSLRSNH